MSAPSSPMNLDPFTAAVSNSEVHNGGGPGQTQELAEQASPAASTTLGLGLGLGQGSPIVVTNGIERMVIDVQESNNASPSPRRADRGPPMAPLVTTPVLHTSIIKIKLGIYHNTLLLNNYSTYSCSRGPLRNRSGRPPPMFSCSAAGS